ncbi:MAG: helix-turn-helix transcriptional regulator [Mangrovibacterium sp.]
MDITQKKVLNFEEACEYTGFKPSYLYKLTAAGKVPCSRPYGKMLFFDREELENFLLGKPTPRQARKRS